MTDTHDIRFVLDWINELDGENFDTLANVRIDLDGQAIWPVWGDDTTDLDVFADDLLSFMTENWRRLLLEQHYPRGLQPGSPSQLLTRAEELAEDQPRTTAEMLFAAVDAFEASHNFTRAIAGQFELPSLWMLRQGDCMVVETGGRAVRIDADAWMSAASEFGDAIGARLRARRLDKYGRLLAAWEARDEGDPIGILSASIGQPR